MYFNTCIIYILLDCVTANFIYSIAINGYVCEINIYKLAYAIFVLTNINIEYHNLLIFCIFKLLSMVY